MATKAGRLRGGPSQPLRCVAIFSTLLYQTLDLAAEKEIRDGFKKRGIFTIAPSLSKADFVFLCITEYKENVKAKVLLNVLSMALKPEDFQPNRADLFNAATVRGSLGAVPGRAVDDLSAVAVIMAEAARTGGVSLDSLKLVLSAPDRLNAVTSLVNIGLLTSSQGAARFIHQSFADFGLAHAILGSIRNKHLKTFTAIVDSHAALLHPELTSNEEQTLISWLAIDSTAVHSRVYRILRRGCSPMALSVVRNIWRRAGLIGRLEDTAEVLAAHGDFEFLREHDIEGSSETAHSRILARVLSRPGRPQYFETILALARSKKKQRYLLALLRVALTLNRHEGIEEVLQEYSTMNRRTRLAIARMLNAYRRSVELPRLLNQLLQMEDDPEVMFMLLYAGRDAVSEVEETALLTAADTLAVFACSHPYQLMLATTIVKSLRNASSEIKGNGRPRLSVGPTRSMAAVTEMLFTVR
jgi:hypothetical protein